MTTIKTNVTSETKTAFNEVARKHGTSESRLLSRIIDAFLQKNASTQIETPAATETRRAKYDLQKMAQENGMSLSSYMCALAKAHLSRGPSWTDKELEVLRRSNSEVSAVARNINQIARALNTSLDNTHLVKAAEIANVAELILAQRNQIRSLIRKNMQAWGVDPS